MSKKKGRNKKIENMPNEWVFSRRTYDRFEEKHHLYYRNINTGKEIYFKCKDKQYSID